MDYKGANGTISMHDDYLTITHSGFNAKLSNLPTNQPKTIPFAAISGVRVKPATVLGGNGFITFGLGGEDAPEMGRTAATQHRDSLMFTVGQNEAFERLHAELLGIIEHNREQGVAAKSASVEVAPVPASFREQMREAAGMESMPRERVPIMAKRLRNVAGCLSAFFGPFGVSNAVDGEIGEPEVGIEYVAVLFPDTKYYPLHEVSFNLIVGQTQQRMTATRVLGGAVIAKGTGALIGGMAKKDKTRAYLRAYRNDTELLTEYTFPAKQVHEAERLMDVHDRLLLEWNRTHPSPAAGAAANSANNDTADQLRKLADLHDAGILTDDEFAAKKKQLLDRI